jgi:hypothetical protein
LGAEVVPLTVRLDSETKRCLQELLAITSQVNTTLIRQLIRDRWQQRRLLSSRLAGWSATDAADHDQFGNPAQ